MRLLTISNLYPRPDQPQRGVFNRQLFDCLAGKIAEGRGVGESGGWEPFECCTIENICLVPEWRIWRWPGIREWRMPAQVELGDQSAGDGGRVPRQKARQAGVRTIYLPVFYLPVIGRSLSWRFNLRALAQVVRGWEGIEAVFATWLYPDGVAAIELAQRMKVPSLVLVQGSDILHLENPGRKEIILRACGNARGVVCVCQSLADRVISAGVDGRKVHVVHNGVDNELFRFRNREEAVSRLTSSVQWAAADWAGRRLILFVGNLVPVKGPDLMLEAWSVIKRSAEFRDAVLVMIGDGPMRRTLERQAVRLGIEGSVLFLGVRSHEEVAFWMNAAECLCLPSRSEGMPNVVIEALVSGLPVVAADVGGVREILEPEKTARIVAAPADRRAGFSAIRPADMAAAVAGLLEEGHARLALAARNAGRFSWQKQAEQMLDIIAVQKP